MNYPRRVPMRIEYRKNNRAASSLCYVLAQEDGVLWCAGTLDGGLPLGLVTIAERDIQRAMRLADGAAIE